MGQQGKSEADRARIIRIEKTGRPGHVWQRFLEQLSRSQLSHQFVLAHAVAAGVIDTGLVFPPPTLSSRVGLNFGARPPERQYLASLLWDLLANDYAATYLDAPFVDAISAR